MAAVIGAGAIGGYLAAMLLEAGEPVTLCVRTPFDRLTIAIADEIRELPVTIVCRPDDVRETDLVVVATKAQDSESAGGWLARLAGSSTRVLVAQNGIEHRSRTRPMAPTATIVPSVVYIAAERTAPGRIVHHGSSRLIVPDDADGAAVAGRFAGSTLNVEKSADFETTAWRKLLANLVANPITALTLRRMDVFDAPAVRDLSRRLLEEAVAVGKAAGAQLTDQDIARTEAMYDRIDAASGSSMLYDRLSGRSLEYEHLTGAVLRAAEANGVAAPLNRAVYALLDGLNQSPEWRR